MINKELKETGSDGIEAKVKKYAKKPWRKKNLNSRDDTILKIISPLS